METYSHARTEDAVDHPDAEYVEFGQLLDDGVIDGDEPSGSPSPTADPE